MDPITAFAIKAGTSWLGSKFRTLVIDRWTRRRAEAFFKTFVEELAEAENIGQSLGSLERTLAELLDDKTKSEVLFDAYRRVSMSASPSLGPRIIAVLTARLIAQGRLASPEEERLLMVAETLRDNDLTELSAYLSDHPPVNYEVKLFDQTEDSNALDRTVSISSVNLGENIGNWCLKLANAGLVVQDVIKTERDYRGDLDSPMSDPGMRTTYVWSLRFQPEVLELKGIIDSLAEVSVDPSGLG